MPHEDDKVVQGSIFHIGCDKPMMTSDDDAGVLTCPVCGLRENEGTVVQELTVENVVTSEVDRMLGEPDAMAASPERGHPRFKLVEN